MKKFFKYFLSLSLVSAILVIGFGIRFDNSNFKDEGHNSLRIYIPSQESKVDATNVENSVDYFRFTVDYNFYPQINITAQTDFNQNKKSLPNLDLKEIYNKFETVKTGFLELPQKVFTYILRQYLKNK